MEEIRNFIFHKRQLPENSVMETWRGRLLREAKLVIATLCFLHNLFSGFSQRVSSHEGGWEMKTREPGRHRETGLGDRGVAMPREEDPWVYVWRSTTCKHVAGSRKQCKGLGAELKLWKGPHTVGEVGLKGWINPGCICIKNICMYHIHFLTPWTYI